MNYPLYLLFGLAPSIIWLLFFLKKDNHPESNGMIIKIFFYGMLIAIPTAIIEIGFFETIKTWHIPVFLLQVVYIFIGIGLTEEFLKFWVVKKKVINNKELDEPVDLMLYMIIAALGFAALENLLVLLPLLNPFMFFETVIMSGFRFIGATFLHTLCSGLVGYFMAISFYNSKEKRFKTITLGITIATLLHGLYDFSIIELDSNIKFAIPLLILLSLTIFVTWGFQKVKKLKSICLLNSPN